jgi:phosphate transport system protein
MEVPVRDHLERRLDDLLTRVVELGERTDEMLGAALEALQDGDADAAGRVVAADVHVDRLDHEVQQLVVETIARHGPVGRDLRLLTATLRATLHLERMGDYAVNVARAAERSAPFPADVDLAAQLTEMGALAREVGRQAVQAFVHGDADLARAVPAMDDGVDRLNIGIFHRLVRLASADEHRLEWATRMILVARLIERYGDHGVDLAEQAIFVATGETVELSSNDPAGAPAGGSGRDPRDAQGPTSTR